MGFDRYLSFKALALATLGAFNNLASAIAVAIKLCALPRARLFVDSAAERHSVP